MTPFRPTQEPIIPSGRPMMYVKANVIVRFDVVDEEEAVQELVSRLAGTKLASSLYAIHVESVTSGKSPLV